jgi:hypothetical protein
MKKNPILEAKNSMHTVVFGFCQVPWQTIEEFGFQWHSATATPPSATASTVKCPQSLESTFAAARLICQNPSYFPATPAAISSQNRF